MVKRSRKNRKSLRGGGKVTAKYVDGENINLCFNVKLEGPSMDQLREAEEQGRDAVMSRVAAARFEQLEEERKKAAEDEARIEKDSKVKVKEGVKPDILVADIAVAPGSEYTVTEKRF